MAYFAPIRPYFSFLQWFFLQVSYAIGVAEPLSVTVFDYGTGAKSSAELNEIVKKNFDLRYFSTTNSLIFQERERTFH